MGSRRMWGIGEERDLPAVICRRIAAAQRGQRVHRFVHGRREQESEEPQETGGERLRIHHRRCNIRTARTQCASRRSCCDDTIDAFSFLRDGDILALPTASEWADLAGLAGHRQPKRSGLIQDYVRINTSNPPGDVLKAADFLSRILEREGIPVKRTTPARPLDCRRAAEGERHRQTSAAASSHGRRPDRRRPDGSTIRSPPRSQTERSGVAAPWT